jgi:hemoglobin
MKSLYDHAGGEHAMHHFVEVFYRKVLADPLLHPLFGDGKPTHVPHLTAFMAETFGGPDMYTREMGGFPALIAAHRNLKITEDQRQRFIALHDEAADEAGLPSDAPFREALRTHVEFGTQVAMQNSNAKSDSELHPLRVVPIWNWPSGGKKANS